MVWTVLILRQIFYSSCLFSSFFFFIIIVTPLVLLFQSPPVLLSILRWLYQEHKLQLVSSSFSCSTIFSRSRYLSFFQHYSVVCRDSKGHNSACSLFFPFLLIITRSGRLADIRWSVCISKSQRSLCLILQDRFLSCAYTICSIVKFKFLAQFPVDHFAHPVVPSLIFFLC